MDGKKKLARFDNKKYCVYIERDSLVVNIIPTVNVVSSRMTPLGFFIFVDVLKAHFLDCCSFEN